MSQFLPAHEGRLHLDLWQNSFRNVPHELAYAIGVAEPLAIYVDLHGTGRVDEAKLETSLREVMRLTPRGIREHLQLNKPIYARTSSYGHFGRVPDSQGGFSWEKTDLADALKRHFA